MNKVISVLKSIVVHVLVFSMLVVLGFVIALGLVSLVQYADPIAVHTLTWLGE